MSPRGGARPGAGRPAGAKTINRSAEPRKPRTPKPASARKPETTPVFTRLTLDERAAVKDAAADDAVEASYWIRVAVQERLARLARKRKGGPPSG